MYDASTPKRSQLDPLFLPFDHDELPVQRQRFHNFLPKHRSVNVFMKDECQEGRVGGPICQWNSLFLGKEDFHNWGDTEGTENLQRLARHIDCTPSR